MAKVRKHHNPKKRWQNQAVASLRRHNCCVAYSYNNGASAVVFNRSTLGKIRVRQGSVVQIALAEVRHRWSIFLAVLCRDQNGTCYMKSEIIQANEPYLQSELAGVCEDQHRNLILSANENHLINVCWIGIPYGGDITEAEASKIFDEYGYWDLPLQDVANG